MIKKEKLKTYLKMAEVISMLSPDEETKVGAIMLSYEGRIIASSYNGFLRQANDKILPKTRPDKYEFIQHAERNMIYNCAYEGVKTKDSIVVTTLSPCLECLRACYQAGVKVIVYKDLYRAFTDSDVYTELPDLKVQVSKIDNLTVLTLNSVIEKDT